MSDRLAEAIIGMDEECALTIVSSLLDAGVPPIELLEQARRAMVVLGEHFQQGAAFIPELVMGGEIMRQIAESLQPHLHGAAPMDTKRAVVLGTVRGDVHDIGKDIVATMLTASGFQVVDLGVNVPPEIFVAAVAEHDAAIVGLSGLLTVAFDSMKATVEALEADGRRCSAKVMIGGAPVDERVAEYVGADGWGKDAAAAAALAARWASEQ